MAPSSALYVLFFCLKAHGQNNSRGRSDGHRLPHTLHTLSWLHFLQLLGADGKSLDVLRTQIGIPSSPASPQPLPLQPISLCLSLSFPNANLTQDPNENKATCTAEHLPKDSMLQDSIIALHRPYSEYYPNQFTCKPASSLFTRQTLTPQCLTQMADNTSVATQNSAKDM